MSTILVLGGTGFIGHHVVHELLARGYRVRVLARPGGDRSLLSDTEAEIVDGDLNRARTIKAALDGCDGLVHAAAHYPTWSIKPDREEQLGRDQILRVHEALRVHPVKRFVYLSTFTAVGRYPDGRPEDEDAPFPQKRWRSTYARVKREMQELVLYNARRTNATIVAPSGVYGPGDRKPTTGRLIVDIANRKLPATLRGMTNAVHVRAVREGVAEALQRGRTGRLYVLGGENLTIPALCDRIAQIAGVPRPYVALPPELLHPLAWLGEQLGSRLELSSPPVPLVGVDFARTGEAVSSEVARRELGYEPEKYPLDEAIKEALAWFHEHRMIDRNVRVNAA